MNLIFKQSVRTVTLPVMSAILALFLATSCQFYQEKDGGDDAPLVTLRTVSYRTVMQNVISTRCVRCHADEFSSFDAIRRRISDIERRALIQRDMPPGAPLSKGEAKTLRLWIEAKMPLNAGEAGGAPIPPPPPLVPTFQSIRENVFTPRCVTCHGPNGKHHDINVFDQGELTKASEKWIVPYDPDKSELYQDIIKTGRGRMPPIAKPGKPEVPPLTAEQIDVIRTWILNGAKD